jgi:sensor histidine kinase YesM
MQSLGFHPGSNSNVEISRNRSLGFHPRPNPHDEMFRNRHFEFHPRPIIPFFVVQMNNAVILFIIALIIFRENEKKVINENAQLKLINLEAQQQKLRQQIQPHFLFNSLSTLKSLIKKHPDEAEEYLIKLSSFLRVNINSNTQNLIPLEEEMLICSDYLSIQKVRFKNSLQYSIEIPKEVYSGKVPIFAIQSLLENAIKHNALTESEPLKITIRYTLENKISVTNNIQPKQISDSSTGMGLKNLKERYKLLTDKPIEIKQTDNLFEVILPLL